MKSIRRNLLLALLGTMCAAMLIAGWATYRAAHHEADALFDYHLRQIALSVRDQTFLGSPDFLANDENLDYVIRVWDLSGLTVYYSKPHESLPELTQLGYSIAETSEGEWRVFATQYHGLTIAVAQPMRVRNRLATDAAWNTLRPFFFLLPVVGMLVWVLVGLGLRPLARLAESVRKRTPDSLAPLPDEGLPEEIQPLAASLNDLLARLQAAFAAPALDEAQLAWALADFVPAEDAPVVRALRDAGAIVLGKTNMHELAFGATGYNAAFHVPEVVGVRNPYDARRIAGGSSSGSAAALGARMAPAALASDTPSGRGTARAAGKLRALA